MKISLEDAILIKISVCQSGIVHEGCWVNCPTGVGNLKASTVCRHVAKILLTGADIHGSHLSFVPTCTPSPSPLNFLLLVAWKWYIMVNFLTVRTQFTIYYVRKIFFSDLMGDNHSCQLSTPLTVCWRESARRVQLFGDQAVVDRVCRVAVEDLVLSQEDKPKRHRPAQDFVWSCHSPFKCAHNSLPLPAQMLHTMTSTSCSTVVWSQLHLPSH